MNIFTTRSAAAGILSAAVVLGAPFAALAATTPSLGTAASYAVLGKTFNNTTIANGTAIYGDMGYVTFPGVAVYTTGTTHLNDAAFLQAGIDQHAASAALDAQACTFTFPGAVDLATDVSHGALGVYTPGVYCSAGNMSIGGGGTISLSGAGTFIFRPSGTLTTTDFSTATTTNGASACDIFWTPHVPPVLASTVIGSNATFVGTVIEPVGPVNSDITVGGGTKWVGRALAFDWTVTTNPIILKYITITAPTCPVPPPPPPATATLHVVKHVINNDGGVAVASSFTLHVKGATGMGMADVAGSPAAGVEAPGTSYTLSAGAYAVSEDTFSGYASGFSGACDANGSVSLLAGDDKTCTITNDDIAVPPPVVPPVVPPVDPPVVVPPPVLPPVIPPVVTPPVVTSVTTSVSTPSAPNTGAGGNARETLLILVFSALVAAGSALAYFKQRKHL
ncbi:DUF3494 domain-containing protein [Candidatus Uhrbacteria bacterium]|nr:DUF3494 domain-containing protein [Candidatus Uhrbacteria bacterium]